MKTNSQLGRRPSSGSPLSPVGERQRLEVAVAARRRRPRCGSRTSMFGGRLDPLDEVAATCDVLERRPAHQHHDPLGVAREVERRLAGGVGGADDVHVLALDLGGLARAGAVVDAASGELVEPVGVEPAVGDAGGDDHGARLDLAPPSSSTARTGPRDSKPTTSRASTISAPNRRDLGDGALGEVGPAEPLREAEVVLDRRALAGLPAGRLALDDDGAQPLGRGVDGGGQPGRPAADDAQVVERLLGAGAQARARSASSSVVGAPERLGVGDQHQRQVVGAGAGELDQPGALGVALDVEPAVGHVVAGEERLDLVAAVGPAVADHPDLAACSGCSRRQSSSRSSTTG